MMTISKRISKHLNFELPHPGQVVDFDGDEYTYRDDRWVKTIKVTVTAKAPILTKPVEHLTESPVADHDTQPVEPLTESPVVDPVLTTDTESPVVDAPVVAPAAPPAAAKMVDNEETPRKTKKTKKRPSVYDEETESDSDNDSESSVEEIPKKVNKQLMKQLCGIRHAMGIKRYKEAFNRLERCIDGVAVKPVKRTRKRSAYSKHMSVTMRSLKRTDPSMSSSKIMSEAIRLWKEKKEETPVEEKEASDTDSDLTV
jgi:hypothetical protein